ncbi:hypothetical protein [Kutzneria kofuensis]|uniref:Uncharacterized protein n=1 Tax=Kutzneria kofuensis TaxID=103725 RepID=A0A7W9NI50_9PSEU|nr:hypothetical protein [Kutzneria kofuensis]MBB5892926.1 hypothetical protein [Kutzneria kofuensis]
MSPASRKRKPKRNNAGRPRPPRVSPLAETVEQALEITSLVQARTWASDLIGHYRAVAWDTGDDPDIAIGQLRFEIADVGGAAGTAAALALSLVGRRKRRAEFAALGEELALATGSMPAWYAGDLKLRLLAARSITDANRDYEAIVLEYHDHTLGVIVEHVGLMRLLSVVVRGPQDGVAFVRELARAISAHGEPVALSPTEVSYRLFGPVTMFVDEGPDFAADLPAAQVRKVIGRTALMEAVLTDLPPAPADEGVIEQFMATCDTDEKWSRWWAGFVVRSAEETGRAVTDFGLHFGHAQILKLAREVAMPEADVPALTEAIRAWARFTNADWTDDLSVLLEGYAILNARVTRS